MEGDMLTFASVAMNKSDIEGVMNASVTEVGDVNVDTNGGMSPLLFVVALLVAFIIARIVARYVFGAGGLSSRHRHTLLLIGLCGSGKTALFAQLVAQKCVPTRTSMVPNRGTTTRRSDHRPAGANASPSTTSDGAHSPVTVVDFPGHRRLRDSLTPALEEAKNVVLVVDAVTIQDDRHEGAQALAEFVVSVFSSPSFYGVQRVLVACTKRDELTSYSSKAVRRLLEAEIARCIASRQGDLQTLDNIVNSTGVTVGQRRHKLGTRTTGAAGRAHQLSLGDSGKFSCDDFPVPIYFADISSMVNPEQHNFNVEPVWNFVEGRM